MGTGCKYKCKECKRQIEILEGVGMLDFPQILIDDNSELNLLRRYDNGLNKEKLRKIIKEKQHILVDGYGYKTYQCPTCKKVSNEFYFKLESLKTDGEDFISEYQCYKCKNKLEKLENIERCPICNGEFDKEEIIFINWD